MSQNNSYKTLKGQCMIRIDPLKSPMQTELKMSTLTSEASWRLHKLTVDAQMVMDSQGYCI
jgi:hypothetical protein